MPEAGYLQDISVQFIFEGTALELRGCQHILTCRPASRKVWLLSQLSKGLCLSMILRLQGLKNKSPFIKL